MQCVAAPARTFTSARFSSGILFRQMAQVRSPGSESSAARPGWPPELPVAASVAPSAPPSAALPGGPSVPYGPPSSSSSSDEL